jgi:hypothetical protein
MTQNELTESINDLKSKFNIDFDTISNRNKKFKKKQNKITNINQISSLDNLKKLELTDDDRIPFIKVNRTNPM